MVAVGMRAEVELEVARIHPEVFQVCDDGILDAAPFYDSGAERVAWIRSVRVIAVLA